MNRSHSPGRYHGNLAIILLIIIILTIIISAIWFTVKSPIEIRKNNILIGIRIIDIAFENKIYAYGWFFIPIVIFCMVIKDFFKYFYQRKFFSIFKNLKAKGLSVSLKGTVLPILLLILLTLSIIMLKIYPICTSILLNPDYHSLEVKHYYLIPNYVKKYSILISEYDSIWVHNWESLVGGGRDGLPSAGEIRYIKPFGENYKLFEGTPSVALKTGEYLHKLTGVKTEFLTTEGYSNTFVKRRILK